MCYRQTYPQNIWWVVKALFYPVCTLPGEWTTISTGVGDVVQTSKTMKSPSHYVVVRCIVEMGSVDGEA